MNTEMYENGLVSVIITSYNSDNSLSCAIDSVLNQSYRNVEVIVVDDNNPEMSARKRTELLMQQYAENAKVKYIKHEHNKNGAAARNTGIQIAKGEYIAFLDDDDEYYKNRIRICVDTLSENPEYDAVYTEVDLYHLGEKIGVRNTSGSGLLWKKLLLDEGFLGTGSNIFVRRIVFKDTDVFDVRFLRYQDVEFMLRVLEKHPIIEVRECLVKKNIGRRNIPEYKKYHENKLLIFEKFQKQIETLDNNERQAFFEFHYYRLFESAMLSCNRKNIKQAAKELSNVRTLTYKEKIGILIPKVWVKRKKLI